MTSTRFGAMAVLAAVSLSCGEGLMTVNDMGEELASTEHAVVSAKGQGSRYQGSRYQGSRYQGSRYQGSRYQGSRYQGATLGGLALSDATLQGTGLVVWRKKAGGWEQRFPNQLCQWDSKRTRLKSCSTVNLTTSPSPLVGSTFQASFVDEVTGASFNGAVRIDQVEQDAELSMFPQGGDASCQLITNQALCDHPGGCRRNCDVFLYTLTLVDSSTGAEVPFCDEGEVATSLSGTWDVTGRFVASTTDFTMACTNGTIAKCARWGYKPWRSATKANGVVTSLVNHHLACTRAATADYCGSGQSFTHDGTLVDVYDPDFIPVTRGGTQPNATATAFAWEGWFDKNGAMCVDKERYAEAGSLSGACPSRFTYPILAVPAPCNSAYGNSWVQANAVVDPVTLSLVPADGVRVGIDMTTGCAHSERIPGKWLHRACTTCAFRVGQSSTYSYCTNASDPRGWDSACVAQAQALCSASEFSAPHSECTAGAALQKFDTACTLQLCLNSATSYCCNALDARGFDAACVAAANATCTGGREGQGACLATRTGCVTPPVTYGFCGTAL